MIVKIISDSLTETYQNCFPSVNKFAELEIFKNILQKSTEITLHINLLQIFSMESSLSVVLNEILRSENLNRIRYVFPFFFFLQHSLFLSNRSIEN